MSTIAEDTKKIAGYFKPSVEKLVAAASLCWSELDRAGEFDMGLAKQLVDNYCITLAGELRDAVIIVDEEIRQEIPTFVRLMIMRNVVSQIETNLEGIETYLDRAIRQMQKLTEEVDLNVHC